MDTRVVKDISGTIDLCETFSETYQISKVGTDEIYTSGSAIDIILGYDVYNKPYSRFVYIETSEPIAKEEEGVQE